ncbi:MAG TPA: hypothetical protein VGK67_14255 [Myxococcales bacterium]|jgi:hypothetical protein
MTRRILLQIAAVLALAFAPGCKSGQPAGGPCTTAKDCSKGQCVLGSCSDCEAGEKACACKEDGTCAGELTCQGEVCNPKVCTAGTVGCPCDAKGACATGVVCKAGTCAPCTNDVVGCPCAAGACLGALVCDAASMACRAPRPCSATTCQPNQKCGDGEAGKDAACLAECAPGYTWNATAGACEAVVTANCEVGTPGSILADCQVLHRTCQATASGAECGACVAGFTNTTGTPPTCRPLATCADLGCTALYKLCTEATDTVDATCGACLDGYRLEGGQCLPMGTCEALGCAGLNRTCEALGCGACLPGYLTTDAADPMSACGPPCGVLPKPCGAAQFCVAGACVDAPCKADQAMRQDTNQCVTCGSLCNGEGETGRYWAYTQADSNTCLCETRPGYFVDLALSLTAAPCDADGDGWVRSTARLAVESADPAIRANARCDVRRIDRVVLANEYRQTLAIDLVATGTIAGTSLALYESALADDQTQLDQQMAKSAWAVNGNGRLVRAAEINPFTKACVNELADFNDNGVADVDESQGGTLDAAHAAYAAFAKFAYFMELYAGAYVPPAAGETYGSYVIEERSRCTASAWQHWAPLAVGYESGANDSWRNCARATDWTGAAGEVGADFGKWNPAGAPPPIVDAPQDPDALMPAHGLCEVSLPAGGPADGVWRGMNHESQFKCVVVTNTIPSDPVKAKRSRKPQDLMPQNAAPEHFNLCHIECPGGAACPNSSQGPAGALPNPSSPVLTCESVTDSVLGNPKPTLVGFAAYRYSATATRGCINEANEPAYRALCPAYLRDPAVVTSSTAKFGSLVCGCGEFLGGVNCKRGCAPIDSFKVSNYDPATRAGYWMCVHPVASQATVLQQDPAAGTGYRVTGRIPVRIVNLAPKSENAADPAQGYSVH